MKSKQQFGLAWKNIDDEHQLQKTAPRDQAAAIDVLAQTNDVPAPHHPPEAYSLIQPEAEAEV